MTESTLARIPGHLKRYIVDQNYARYTAEDQAVWRYCLRQLKNFLSEFAHESYLSGLKATGISIDRIPTIDQIDQHLNKLGWGAVPVSGFIPPAAFMEFQAIGVLPIVSDMRTIEHLQYTPAPDIVHEAAGHAPILANAEYANYIRQYGEIARHAIITKQDMDQYDAIRILSDIKEDSRSTPGEVGKAEKRLNEVNAQITGVSEAALLSRMNWWTAEYGLIGEVANPKLFGAGLLSSVGEARTCLQPNVKKLVLSVDCVDFGYDITERQPQLFVAKDFAHLSEVLAQLSPRLAYRRGGIFGLEQARDAETVTTTQLNSGLQISGVLKNFLREGVEPAYLQFVGPCQLSHQYAELPAQGIAQHRQGFSSPLGLLKNQTRCLSEFSAAELAALGLKENARVELGYQSGVVVNGIFTGSVYRDERLILLIFKDARVTRGSELLFDPAWGVYDMAVGSTVTSVFGGPADREHYGLTEDFNAKKIPPRMFQPAERKRHSFYEELRTAREGKRSPAAALTEFRKLTQAFVTGPMEEWLPGIELLELSHQLGLPDEERAALRIRLQPDRFTSEHVRESVQDGIRLSETPS